MAFLGGFDVKIECDFQKAKKYSSLTLKTTRNYCKKKILCLFMYIMLRSENIKKMLSAEGDGAVQIIKNN